MNLKLLILPLGLLAIPALAQKPRLNQRLRYQLDSLDQAYKRYEQQVSSAFDQAQSDSLLKPLRLPDGSLAGYSGPRLAHPPSPDSTGLRFVSTVIRRYGYPGPSLVGKPAGRIAWELLQRTQQTGRFLPQLRAAADAGELPFEDYAWAVDNQLVHAGKKQKYGTQIVACMLQNKATGEMDMVRFLWPVEDMRRANELRRQAHIPTTVAQAAEEMGVSSEPVSLEYALRMKRAAETGE